jgi:hypothetical protein
VFPLSLALVKTNGLTIFSLGFSLPYEGTSSLAATSSNKPQKVKSKRLKYQYEFQLTAITFSVKATKFNVVYVLFKHLFTFRAINAKGQFMTVKPVVAKSFVYSYYNELIRVDSKLRAKFNLFITVSTLKDNYND